MVNIQEKNFDINVMNTKKFKSTRVRISFSNALSEQTVTKRAILPYLMRAISKKYDTRSKMSLHLENMYAAQFNVGTAKIGETHVITFNMSIINDAYTIDEENLFEDAIIFLKEILFNPLFEENIFEEEKRLLDEYFMSVYANKMRYTIKELQKNMFSEELYKISALGLEKDLDTLTLEDCINEYKSMLVNDLVTISVVGDCDTDYVVNIVKKHLSFENNKRELSLLEYNPDKKIEYKEITLTQQVEQAKLAIGYRFEVRYLDDDYYPALLFDQLLGGSSDSLLHRRVREELGLVYFISSSYDIYKGALFIFSGINSTSYNQTVEEVNKIITSIQEGTFEPYYLEIAKKSMINSIIESYDSNYNLIIKLERRDFFDRFISMEEAIERVNKVTIEDIKKVAKKLTIDTAVLLKGEHDE